MAPGRPSAALAALAWLGVAVPAQPAEERAVEFAARGVTLKGTLSLPQGEPGAQHPAVVLVHGSGPQSRDQRLPGQLNMSFGFEIPVFARLAEALSAAGFAVLRYDKRTCGPFNGCAENGYPLPPDSLTARDLIADVEAALDFLGGQAGVDRSRLFVVGHSQGATFVPELMSRRPDLAGGVMIAPSHRPIDELIAYQLAFSRELAAESGVLSAERVERQLAGLVVLSDELAALRAATHDGTPIGGASAAFWESLFEIGDRAPALARELDRPLLALGGDYDWNVPPEEIEAWRSTLARSRHDPGHRALVLPCVTHALNCVSQRDHERLRPSDLGRDLHPRVAAEIIGFLAGLR